MGEGVQEDIDNRTMLLLNELWCNKDRVLFPETVEVKYFTSFTASSLVGAGKPSPIIFNAALEAQGILKV